MFRTQLKKAAAWVLAVGCGGMFAYDALTAVLAFAAVGTVECASFAADDAPKVPALLIRSAGSGLWSAPATWEGSKVPDEGARVQIRTGHRVVYDLSLPIVDRDEGGRHTPFFGGYKPQFFFRTTNVTGEMQLPEGIAMVIPGDNAAVIVSLDKPVALDIGSHFAIREGGKTVGSGVITEVVE